MLGHVHQNLTTATSRTSMCPCPASSVSTPVYFGSTEMFTQCKSLRAT